MCRTRIIQCEQQFCPRVMHRQKAWVFPSWMTLISNLSVFQGVYPVQLNPPTSQQLCLLCRTMAPKFANQLPIRNVGRTCNGSGNVWNWESRSRCTGTLQNTAPHKIRCDNLFFNFAAWRCYACNLRRKHPEKRSWVAKTNPLKRLVCWLENLRFQFQKLLCK